MTKHNTQWKLAGAVAFWIVGAALANAQEPLLAGTWKLNVGKSSIAAEHPGADYTITKVVTVSENTISISDRKLNASMAAIPYPETPVTRELVTDGEEHDMKVGGPVPQLATLPAKVATEWQGSTLFIRQRGDGPVFSVLGRVEERMFLTQDHSQLIVLLKRRSTFFDTDERYVFEKQQ